MDGIRSEFWPDEGRGACAICSVSRCWLESFGGFTTSSANCVSRKEPNEEPLPVTRDARPAEAVAMIADWNSTISPWGLIVGGEVLRRWRWMQRPPARDEAPLKWPMRSWPCFEEDKAM